MKQIELAEQQLLGFFHAKKGFSLNELLTSMGLTEKEWERMESKGMVDWMSNKQKNEIRQYFYKHPSNQ